MNDKTNLFFSCLLLLKKLFSAAARDQEKDRGPEPDLDPTTIVEADDILVFDKDGWAVNSRVIQVPSRAGWYYRKLRTKSGLPEGIVCHFTSTNAGTAMAMAVRRRDRSRKSFENPPGSWHFTVAKDGTIIQQLSLKCGGFHAGSKSARRLPIGWANFVTAGVEFEGHGKDWPDAQVEAAIWLWKGLVSHCPITVENAFHKHSWIDPVRKDDPGRLFVETVEPRMTVAVFEEVA